MFSQAEATDKNQEQRGGVADRRKTIAKLSAYHEKTGGKSGEDLNLERQFKQRFANMGNECDDA